MSHSHDSSDQHQFVISHELLRLLEWLIIHEQQGLKQLITRALNRGLLHEAQSSRRKNISNEELQYTIIEFFALLDIILHETLNEDESQMFLQRALVPALNNVDCEQFDSSSLSASIAKATAAVSRVHTGQTAKEVLCKELLKRWKPHKSLKIN